MVGRKVVAVREMTEHEIKAEGWDRGTTAIEFDDGSVIYASRDEEGNGAGEMFGYNKKDSKQGHYLLTA